MASSNHVIIVQGAILIDADSFHDFKIQELLGVIVEEGNVGYDEKYRINHQPFSFASNKMEIPWNDPSRHLQIFVDLKKVSH